MSRKNSKEIETLKSTKKFLELENSMNEMKNNWKALEIAILWKENYEVNNRNLEIIQVEEERVVRYLKNEEILQELSDS